MSNTNRNTVAVSCASFDVKNVPTLSVTFVSCAQCGTAPLSVTCQSGGKVGTKVQQYSVHLHHGTKFCNFFVKYNKDKFPVSAILKHCTVLSRNI